MTDFSSALWGHNHTFWCPHTFCSKLSLFPIFFCFFSTLFSHVLLNWNSFSVILNLAVLSLWFSSHSFLSYSLLSFHLSSISPHFILHFSPVLHLSPSLLSICLHLSERRSVTQLHRGYWGLQCTKTVFKPLCYIQGAGSAQSHTYHLLCVCVYVYERERERNWFVCVQYMCVRWSCVCVCVWPRSPEYRSNSNQQWTEIRRGQNFWNNRDRRIVQRSQETTQLGNWGAVLL